MRRPSTFLLQALFAALILFGPVRLAQAGQPQQYCEKTNYSASQIADAVNNSSLRDDLKQTSCSLGGLGRFESGGNKGIYNGTCCTGIFQLNTENALRYANATPAQFGCKSLQDQVNAWAELTNDGYNTPAVRTLASMQTFDGQTVDASFIAACIQLGPGNCQKMINGGTCGSWTDSNGTSICDMARNAKKNADASCQEGTPQCAMGPGDFPTTPVAAAAPAGAASDVNVAANQV